MIKYTVCGVNGKHTSGKSRVINYTECKTLSISHKGKVFPDLHLSGKQFCLLNKTFFFQKVGAEKIDHQSPRCQLPGRS